MKKLYVTYICLLIVILSLNLHTEHTLRTTVKNAETIDSLQTVLIGKYKKASQKDGVYIDSLQSLCLSLAGNANMWRETAIFECKISNMGTEIIDALWNGNNIKARIITARRNKLIDSAQKKLP